MVLPVCCPFNSRALIFPKCALPWENGRTFPTMGITNNFFFLQKKLVIQGKHIAMHYSNPRPKFEDWLCNKVRLGSARATEPRGLAAPVRVCAQRGRREDTVARSVTGCFLSFVTSFRSPCVRIRAQDRSNTGDLIY